MNFILLVYVAGALVWSSPTLESMSQCSELLHTLGQNFNPDGITTDGIDRFEVEMICKPLAKWVAA